MTRPQPSPWLDRAKVLAALTRLGEHLAERGLTADVYVVGGAAMSIAYDSRRFTRDVDAVFVPAAEVRREAVAVANELGLGVDWLNDAVKGYIPGTDPAALPVFEHPGLRVTAASARHLLGMKLLAARSDVDRDDIHTLAVRLGLRTVAEVLAVATSLYGEDLILPRTRYLVEELFGSHGDDDRPGQTGTASRGDPGTHSPAPEANQPPAPAPSADSPETGNAPPPAGQPTNRARRAGRKRVTPPRL